MTGKARGKEEVVRHLAKMADTLIVHNCGLVEAFMTIHFRHVFRREVV